MTTNANGSLEAALDRTGSDLDAGSRAARTVNAAVKKARAAAATGTLRDLRASLEQAEQAAAALLDQLRAARAGWAFDEDDYLNSGDYTAEVLETARKMGVAIHQQDARLYCYPSLVRVLPGDRAVLIDRTRERRLRPSLLVAHLGDIQRRPPPFRAEAFLESISEAYRILTGATARGGVTGGVVRLKEIYDLLTLLPGQSREYSLQEFARDVYLLDQSGVITTRRGDLLRFEASTGARSTAATITVVTQAGQTKPYYGIAFTKGG